MTEFTRELYPILIMYGFVLMLGPFVGFAMWMAFAGDRAQALEAEANLRAWAAADAQSPAPADVAPEQQQLVPAPARREVATAATSGATSAA